MLGRVPFFAAMGLFVGAALYSFFGEPPFSWMAGFVYIIYDTGLIVFVAWSVTKNLHFPEKSKSETKLSMSVVVPFYNEEAILPLCLQALQKQSLKPERILFVDDGSGDKSLSLLVQQLQATKNGEIFQSQTHPEIQIFSKERSGKARSLNLALARISTDIIVTLDADTILESEALENIAKSFRHLPDLKATGGVLQPMNAKGWSKKIMEAFQKFEYIRAFLTRQAWMDQQSLILVSGAFAAYRTDLLKEVGGYDADSLVEDYELIHRLYKYCYDHQRSILVGVTPLAKAMTDCPSSIPQFLRQRQRWFGGFLQTLFKYRKMLGDKKYQKLGSLMLPIKSLDTLQPLFGLLALYGLLVFIFIQRQIHPWVLTALLVKLLVDYIYHFYCLHLYNRWQGRRVPASFWLQSLILTLGEPLFFQPLRHLGAAFGWWAFVRRERRWS